MSITGAETTFLTGEGGQSLLEFLFMLPVMVFLMLLMVRVNTVIQIAIVNQKYSRAQIHFLTYNSPNFPEVRLAAAGGDKATDRLELGVSGNVLEADETGAAHPDATTFLLSRKGKPKGNDDPMTEDHRERGNVRIRNTVILCSRFLSGGYTAARQGPEFSEAMRPQFCRGLL